MELYLFEPIQNSRPDFCQPLHHLGERGKRERGASGPWMLERIVQSRHFRKLDWSVEILGEPELLEVCDVSDIPDDRTHQRIVLPMQILIRQFRDEQQRTLARFFEKARDLLLRRRSRIRRRSCESGYSHGRENAASQPVQ